MSLQRLCVKVFADPSPGFDEGALIGVFHDWIRRRVPLGTLVDVADYRHVPDGPAVMLITHEGNFSLDRAQQRTGLLYQRKTTLPGDTGERLVEVTRHALAACRLLEQDPRIGTDLGFRPGELLIIANDRLLAPNTDEVYTDLEPHLRRLGEVLYGEFALRRVSNDPHERLAAHLEGREPADIGGLLNRLGN